MDEEEEHNPGAPRRPADQPESSLGTCVRTGGLSADPQHLGACSMLLSAGPALPNQPSEARTPAGQQALQGGRAAWAWSAASAACSRDRSLAVCSR